VHYNNEVHQGLTSAIFTNNPEYIFRFIGYVLVPGLMVRTNFAALTCALAHDLSFLDAQAERLRLRHHQREYADKWCRDWRRLWSVPASGSLGRSGHIFGSQHSWSTLIVRSRRWRKGDRRRPRVR